MRSLTDRLDPADLATYDKKTLYAPIDEGRVPGIAPRKKKLSDRLDPHFLERWLLPLESAATSTTTPSGGW